MKILTAEQIREIDRLSTEQYGVPSILLMENAGMRVVETLEQHFENLEDLSIGILCGKGNNGGDGFVVARQLIQRGCDPAIFLFAAEHELKGDAKVNYGILRALGSPATVVLEEAEWEEEKLELLDADLIVDALLGTGLTKPVSGLYKSVIETVNEFRRATVVSIDIPSGLPTNQSEPIGPAVNADFTVTFTALKPSLVLPPSHAFAGDVIVADIGNPPQLLESSILNVHLIESGSFGFALEQRADIGNKGDFGKVLVVGGSRGKSGAAAMSGQAALRAGAGLVTVASPAGVLPTIAASMPELMTEPLIETASGTVAAQDVSGLLKGKTVLAIGPGLTTQTETSDFVRKLVRDSKIPVVLDADGLNAFVDHAEQIRGKDRTIVLTPHPGEMARLTGREIGDVIGRRIDIARQFATDHEVYVVLKGFRSVVACPDGAIYINSTGNPGMATGGTGDILTGMIAGIIGQENLGGFVERLCLAVYLHGLAGDIAAEEIGEESMTATDLLRFLPSAWKSLRE